MSQNTMSNTSAIATLSSEATMERRVSLGSEFKRAINSLDHEHHSPVLGCGESRFPVNASFDHDSETDREQVLSKAIRHADRIAFRCGSRSILEFRVVNGCTAFTAIRYTLRANQFQADQDHLSFRDGSVVSYHDASTLWAELESLVQSGLGYLSNNEVGYHRNRFSRCSETEYCIVHPDLPVTVRTDDLRGRDLNAQDGWEARELGEDSEDSGASDVLEDDIDIVVSWLRYWESKVVANLESQAAEILAANRELMKGHDSDETEENPAPRKRGRPRLSDEEKARRAAARMQENLNVPPVKLRGVALAWPNEASLSLKGFRG